ncbi:oxygen-independent coproporphyrinogen III oxidase [Pseudoxanthomonas wuyuanensis]
MTLPPLHPDPRDWPFDAELLRRYDGPGPRYTSYPAAPHFSADFSAQDFVHAAVNSNVGAFSRLLSLYVHVPFCRSPCFYCGCNRSITHDQAQGDRYLALLKQEIALVAPLFDGSREVIQLHLGGGTPNFLRPAQLADLVAELGRLFTFSDSPGRDFSIELDPRFVNAQDIAVLAGAGFNRASLGVQDFDPQVQLAVNRVQSLQQTRDAVDACRAQDMRSINIDLIYGLPLQTQRGFARTLEQVIALRPDRLAVYGYAHLPRLFRAQRQIEEQDLPNAEEKLALLGLAVETLSAAGYRYIGMDHFALPEDDLAVAQQRGDLHRNFMGYTTHAQTDLLGLGVSAISHVGDSFCQNQRELIAWQAAVEEGRLPIMRGLLLDNDDVLRADVIQRLMCLGEVEFEPVERSHGIVFGDYFRDDIDALAPLVRDGLVQVLQDRIQVTSRGRGLLRVIAMRFDRYLDRDCPPATYSRAI